MFNILSGPSKSGWTTEWERVPQGDINNLNLFMNNIQRGLIN